MSAAAGMLMVAMLMVVMLVVAMLARKAHPFAAHGPRAAPPAAAHFAGGAPIRGVASYRTRAGDERGKLPAPLPPSAASAWMGEKEGWKAKGENNGEAG